MASIFNCFNLVWKKLISLACIRELQHKLHIGQWWNQTGVDPDWKPVLANSRNKFWPVWCAFLNRNDADVVSLLGLPLANVEYCIQIRHSIGKCIISALKLHCQCLWGFKKLCQRSTITIKKQRNSVFRAIDFWQLIDNVYKFVINNFQKVNCTVFYTLLGA